VSVGSSTHVWYAPPAGESRLRLRGAAHDQASCSSRNGKVKASTHLQYRGLNNSPRSQGQAIIYRNSLGQNG
jgi:hypothetical protein